MSVNVNSAAQGYLLGASIDAPDFSRFTNEYAGPIMGILGGLQAGYGSFLSARSLKKNLEFQSDMAAINARMAERTAQSITRAGERAQSMVSLKAGKIKGEQKARQGARGIQIGVGSAAEEIATTDLMKDIDMMTINANTVRQAMAERVQATNYENEALSKEVTAESVSPYISATESLIGSATTVASSWYRSRRLNEFMDKMGV